jgi:hypothetical protein
MRCRDRLWIVRRLYRLGCCKAIQYVVELARDSLGGFEAKYTIGLNWTGDTFKLRHQDRKIPNDVGGLQARGKLCFL